MAIKVDELKEKVVPAECFFTGDKLNFEYKISSLNEDYYEAVADAQRNDDMDGLMQALVKVLVSWDLMGSDGKMFPLDSKKIREAKLPLPLFGVINQSIQENAQDGGKGLKRGR